MTTLDPFTTQIVNYVRSMPDEALLALVRAHLGGGGSVQLPTASSVPTGTTKRAGAVVVPASRGPKRKLRAKRASSAQRGALLDTVEKLVKKSRGLSSSELAKKAGVPQSRVSAALRDLKTAKRIFQGGERRFARYAGDAKTAQRASLRARKG